MRRVYKNITTINGNLLHIFICKFITKIIAALVLNANPWLPQMGWCVQYCMLFKKITTQVGPLPVFVYIHITPWPFTSSNSKALKCHSAGNKTNYLSVRQWIHLMPNMSSASHSIFGEKLARAVKEKSFSLKVLGFCPDYVNNIFNRFITHFWIGTGLFVEFHHNLLNLQTLRSRVQIYAVSADFRLHGKRPGSNYTFMYQILSPFSHNTKTWEPRVNTSSSPLSSELLEEVEMW